MGKVSENERFCKSICDAVLGFNLILRFVELGHYIL